MTPGERTAALAAKAADPRLSMDFRGLPAPPGATPEQVSDQLRWAEVHRTLSRYNCWDAMLACALLSNSIDSPRLQEQYSSGSGSLRTVQTDDYAGVFTPNRTFAVSTPAQLRRVPPGAFIGFINDQNRLMHAMVYTGGGRAAGTANGCVFPSARAGWESIDLREFFTDPSAGTGRRMVYRPVEGQSIR